MQEKLEKQVVAKKTVPKENKAKANKDRVNNNMRDIMVDKIVLHICAGEFGPKLEKAKKILGIITSGKTPQDTKAKVRLPKWGLRPGLAIGSKVTLRGNTATEFLKRALKARGFKIDKRSFDKVGNFAFGIKEYIDLEGMKYDPAIGIFGFDVMVNLKRRGYRVKNRRIAKASVGRKHLITKEDAWDYVSKEFNVSFN